MCKKCYESKSRFNIIVVEKDGEFFEFNIVRDKRNGEDMVVTVLHFVEDSTRVEMSVECPTEEDWLHVFDLIDSDWLLQNFPIFS